MTDVDRRVEVSRKLSDMGAHSELGVDSIYVGDFDDMDGEDAIRSVMGDHDIVVLLNGGDSDEQ